MILPKKFQKALCFECDEYLKFDSKTMTFTCPDCGESYSYDEHEALFDREERMHELLMEDLDASEEDVLSRKDDEYDYY